MEWIESPWTGNSRYSRVLLFNAVLDCILYHLCIGLDRLVRSQEDWQDFDVYCGWNCTGVQGIVGLDLAEKYGLRRRLRLELVLDWILCVSWDGTE